ncbi:YdgH/BhsA/McbA-like domain containing protein [Serratia fonticola]|uniref:YdgH/BhsA/McbA-like domain containing protein n=1 Tax=Serratia fonticola TaxID=47917 RepID=UPI00398BA1F2
MAKVDFEKVKDQYVHVGSISTSGETSQADAKEELAKKSAEKGGDIYVLTSANTDNKADGTAEV